MTNRLLKTERDPAPAIGRLASREHPRTLIMQLRDLWHAINRAPRLSPMERQRLAAALYID